MRRCQSLIALLAVKPGYAAESLIVSTHYTLRTKPGIIGIAPCPPKPAAQVSRRSVIAGCIDREYAARRAL
ncbi:hypothetical protein PSEUDO8O_140077 [Pseudomonas sp. 8O]|nr:hypothetical protein PSEUDO8O_140077 [Pseudomonas sp. 8O]